MKHFKMCALLQWCRSSAAAIATTLLAVLSHHGASAEGIENRKISYVLTDRHWAIYQTPGGKTECPDGFNDGPREQFKSLYPADGKQRSLLETQLAREVDVWFPADSEPAGVSPYRYVVGKTSVGMNLDGKIGPNDFISPEGEAGVDNEMYRVVGCYEGFRGPDGSVYAFETDYMQRWAFDRYLIEITDVDDLTNDADVTVTTYRGLDPLLHSAKDKAFLPGGTQRVDARWGKRYINRTRGKIVDGILTTEPMEMTLPWHVLFQANPDVSFRASRLRLKLTDSSAEGLLGAYVDLKKWQHMMQLNWPTHHSGYGKVSLPSIIRAMWRAADAYPDPATGKNTAISTALEVKFIQTYIMLPEQLRLSDLKVASAK